MPGRLGSDLRPQSPSSRAHWRHSNATPRVPASEVNLCETAKSAVVEMDDRWQRCGREVLSAAIQAAKKGEVDAGDWLAGSSLEVLTVARMAGVSEHGLCRLVETIRVSRHTGYRERFNRLNRDATGSRQPAIAKMS